MPLKYYCMAQELDFPSRSDKIRVPADNGRGGPGLHGGYGFFNHGLQRGPGNPDAAQPNRAPTGQCPGHNVHSKVSEEWGTNASSGIKSIRKAKRSVVNAMLTNNLVNMETGLSSATQPLHDFKPPTLTVTLTIRPARPSTFTGHFSHSSYNGLRGSPKGLKALITL